MAKAPRQNRSSYGIGEWYGRLYRSLTQTDRQELLSVTPIPPCPFIVSMPALASRGKVTCNKNGGVCSLRAFIADDLAFRFGPITATCPNRFLDGGTVFSTIARTLLGDDDAVIVKEVPFLIRPAEPDAETGNNEDVGRIDMVMIRPGLSPLEWCAVEMQAVYFSGGAMSKDIANIRAYTGNGIPGPGAGRRPDFRSCGPKRLMPQLQTKVPTLRRWGKKMAVVVDRPFFDSFGPMDHVPHVSNADIVWFIVRFDENEEAGTAALAVDEIRYTTLERAVEGLTAGIPTSLEDFENKIRAKLR